jgi:ABC-type polysaccharide/polyol phosphate export permease
MNIYDSDKKDVPVYSTLKKVLSSRDLLLILIKKELALRYKRSFIGIWWSLLNPLLTTTVLYYVFNTAFKSKFAASNDFIPYILCGVLLITFFNQSLTMVADSITGNAPIFTKMYVRPELFGISAAIAAAINFCFGLIPLVVVCAINGVSIGLSAISVIFVLVCLVLIAIGLGLLCAIAYIFFEDFRSIISLMVMVIGYMTPVFYPLSALGPHTRPIIEANPLTSLLSIFRSSIGGLEVDSGYNWFHAAGFSIGIFWLGMYVFHKLWPRAIVRL